MLVLGLSSSLKGVDLTTAGKPLRVLCPAPEPWNTMLNQEDLKQVGADDDDGIRQHEPEEGLAELVFNACVLRLCHVQQAEQDHDELNCLNREDTPEDYLQLFRLVKVLLIAHDPADHRRHHRVHQ